MTTNLLTPPQLPFLTHPLHTNHIHLPSLPPPFQIPFPPKKIPQTKKYHPIITFPTLITPATTHYHYLSNQPPKPIPQPPNTTPLPLIFPILTTQNIQHPIQRPRTKAPNKRLHSPVSPI
ncbi:6,7-dimethyl-8-ribityllumazine synthase, partial [Bacillus subtilis]|uniref:6,7-dimethyl-8-ribityllumazine synthase n=1 Tax=Bacillus subtilis TaxID=1423 RepID=UPI00338EB7CA